MKGLSFFLVYFVLTCWFIYRLKSSKTKAWWVKIDTLSRPVATISVAFESPEEAQAHHDAYVEDLEKEGATSIKWTIEQSNPQKLTIEW